MPRGLHGRMSNRLAGSLSPYLLQHQTNPVHWWPWGPEALAEAARRDVPVFVSIGYAACHWCHVMAHESFEDAETAALMNERYVCVKVDREEHPEVDAIYMTALQVQGEGGGWPLSAWCLPDGRPFFCGTYFAPTGRHGRPSFRHVLEVMADAFRDQRADVLENVTSLVEGLGAYDAHHRRNARDAAPGALAGSAIIAAGRAVAARCDARHGGLGGAPKFPSASALGVLRAAARQPHGTPAATAADAWLTGMTERGLYDHVGGGFARYCVDATWSVPHFEKMLYDNAQLLAACAAGIEAHPARGERLTEVIAETVAFLERELQGAQGGLYSSLDADSPGGEGAFYTWTPAHLRAALGPVDAMLVAAAYGVTDAGNFEHGATVLARVTPRGSAADEAALADARGRMRAARDARPRPATDDKVLAGWNGLAISGLVAAARATGTAAPLALAQRVATFVWSTMWTGSELRRVWARGALAHPGTLDDYAHVALGLLELADATGDVTWWQAGATLVAQLRQRFVGERDGATVFFLTDAAAHGPGSPLVHRAESTQDGALPSGATSALQALLRVGLVAGDGEALALAERYLAQRLATVDEQTALATPGLLLALDLYLHHQVVVVSDGAGAEELRTAARSVALPSVLLGGAWASASWREGRGPDARGHAQAFVCRGATCLTPTSEPAALVAQLRQDA